MSHHRIQRIREPYRRSFKLLSTKMWNFVFFARRSITGACLFVFPFCFFSEVFYRPSGPSLSWEVSLYRKLKVLVPFLIDRRICGHLGPLPPSFSQSQQIKIYSYPFCSKIVEKYDNYVFGDDLLPHSPRGRGRKLKTLTSV